jgi:hypothetical protein
MSMSTEIHVVENRRQLREFIRLSFRIHRRHGQWVPPLYRDEWRYFDAKKNSAFAHNDAVLLLAYNNGDAVGRIMGIINRQRNERLGECHARFGFLECYDDPAVAQVLLSYVEEWGRKQGMQKIIGPMGFSEQDPEGFLIEGFQHESTIATYFNFEYIPALMEANGYTKEVDYVVYLLDLNDEIPSAYEKINQRTLQRTRCQVLEFTSRKALKPFIRPILGLMNETFVDLFGYDPLEASEMDALAKQYLPVIDPRFVKAATLDGEVIAFMLGIPNMSEGFRRAKGHLFPFGLLRILAAARRSKQLDLLIGGVKSEHRGKGLDVLGMTLLIQEARQAGFRWIDSHHELEENFAVRAVMERMGGQVYKRFRIYQKTLAKE